MAAQKRPIELYLCGISYCYERSKVILLEFLCVLSPNPLCRPETAVSRLSLKRRVPPSPRCSQRYETHWTIKIYSKKLSSLVCSQKRRQTNKPGTLLSQGVFVPQLLSSRQTRHQAVFSSDSRVMQCYPPPGSPHHHVFEDRSRSQVNRDKDVIVEPLLPR